MIVSYLFLVFMVVQLKLWIENKFRSFCLQNSLNAFLLQLLDMIYFLECSECPTYQLENLPFVIGCTWLPTQAVKEDILIALQIALIQVC